MGQLSHREDVPFPIFDADNHLYEPPEALTKFLPKEYKDYVQYVQVNGRTLDDYFPNEVLKMVIKQPLLLTETAEKFDIVATVEGGGSAGQAGHPAAQAPGP